MSARLLMVQGTMSSVGKSLIVAALCRIFKQEGWRVAPFKAQNMALNSYVTRDGREVGRAQAMQAEAAGVEVTVEMNPILLKPEADSFSQVVVLGKPWARLSARDYWTRRRFRSGNDELWQIVTTALDALRADYDLVIIEGGGSPVELNLRRGDLVNMAIAEYADAPVLLVGDIDRGGIFAQLLGTLMLLEERERARVRGLIVNKFRGDVRLFDDGVKLLEARGGVPVLGVVPYLPDLRIADEDSVALEDRQAGGGGRREEAGGGKPEAGCKSQVLSPTSCLLPPASRLPPPADLDIAVIHLPHISNFDDFDPLRAEPDVVVRFVQRTEDLGRPDLIILPGTKTTIADLKWMHARGLGEQVVALGKAGVAVLGICGGYQMLGELILDPNAVESFEPRVRGLGLLPVVTTFESEKQTVRVRGRILAEDGLLANGRGLEITGYEIHMGRTAPQGPAAALLQITSRRDVPANDTDGVIANAGWIGGTYLHGLFENDALRHLLLNNLAARKGMRRFRQRKQFAERNNFLVPRNDITAAVFSREAEYERLAAHLRASLDLERVLALIQA